MDRIFEIISKNDGTKLNEVLNAQATKKTLSNLDLKTKDIEEFFVFASYTGSVSCLVVLSKLGKSVKEKRK